MFHRARRSCRLGLVALLDLAAAAFLVAAIPGAQAHVGGSASGPLIAIASGTDLDADVQDIAVVRPDGSGFRKLTKHHAGEHRPVWTSNGRWLVFWPGWRRGS